MQDFFDKTVKNQVSLMIINIFDNFLKFLFLTDKNVHTVPNGFEMIKTRGFEKSSGPCVSPQGHCSPHPLTKNNKEVSGLV